ncbi:hypothetical protein NEE14_012210 [Parabacteroides sp. AD58]|uniref:Uncharacterized protein n=1 Tax=Parabacteroides absconsus TaxID=2951805 RepID=A0ABZ2IK54_9BACT
MLKDTKSLGNNKAPACESRGFVLKKEGVLFDTPSFYIHTTNWSSFLLPYIIFREEAVIPYSTRSTSKDKKEVS